MNCVNQTIYFAPGRNNSCAKNVPNSLDAIIITDARLRLKFVYLQGFS